MARMDDSDDGAKWKRGMFQILFVSMGQGDCCIVTCPDGEHIMIDCGSKALESEDAMIDVQRVIRSEALHLAKSNKDKLKALILTHPDIDHISKVNEIIGGSTYGRKLTFAPIPVDAVYFSDNFKRTDFESSPMRYYSAGSCSNTLYNYASVKVMYCVTLRENEQVLHTWKGGFDKDSYKTANSQIKNNRVKVHSGTVSTTSWEVSIIAGNVKRKRSDFSDGDGRNAASLVTLVRFGEEKVLICGDATKSTENYLCTLFKDTDVITPLNLLQAPHHGSDVTSSTQDFIDFVRPKQVVISVQTNEHSHHLPGEDAIERYLRHTSKLTGHTSTYWRSYKATKFNSIKAEWETRDDITYDEEHDNQGRVARYVRTGVKANFKGEVILDGFNRWSKYVLYQNPVAKDIRQTGRDQHITCFIP